MHASNVISAHDIAFQLQGRQARLDDVLPGLQASDRIGMVVNRPCAVMGVSALLMAATVCCTLSPIA